MQSSLERRTGKKIWRSEKLFRKSVASRASLSKYFGQTKFAKNHGYLTYQDYLNSPIWKAKARKYKERFPICEYCRKNKSVHVHHRNYQNVGKEKYWDLIATCEECHKKQHNIVTN